jgi:hypothetical protein
MDTKIVGMDPSDIYAQCCTLTNINLTTWQNTIMKRVSYESTCLFFKIDELTNLENKLHIGVFTQSTVHHKYFTRREGQQM